MSDLLLRRVADTLPTLSYEAWHFGDSVAFEAMVAASDALDDTGYLQFARGFARGWLASKQEFGPLDCTAPGAALCEIAARTDDAALVDALVALAAYLTDRPVLAGVYQTWSRSPLRESYGRQPLTEPERDLLADPGPGVFVDCLHFDPPFFAALAGLTGDPSWLARSTRQALGYIDLLQDADTGLFHHFFLERTGRAHILGWGRGQGWALLGLLAVLSEVAESAERERISGAARSLVNALLDTQREDGHWNAVVDRSCGGVETSTAAFMAVGLARAAGLGVVSSDQVSGAVERAIAATRDSIDPDGTLTGVSSAVWACTSIGHYDDVPRGVRVPWGQGPATLALITQLGLAQVPA